MQSLYLSALPTAASPPVGPFRFSLKAIALLTAVFSIVCAGRAAAGTAPMFTSPSTVTFPQGVYSSFTVTTSGDPVPAITKAGNLPGGVKFVDNGDGTATISGRPGSGQGLIGDYVSHADGIERHESAGDAKFHTHDHQPTKNRKRQQHHLCGRQLQYFYNQGAEDCSEIYSELYRRPASRCHLRGQ